VAAAQEWPLLTFHRILRRGSPTAVAQSIPIHLPLLRAVILINAIATIAVGVVLFVVPGAIPSVVGIALASDQAFVAWLLGAAEFAVAALCIGTSGWPSEPS
jgi:hypothetical protein